MRFFVAGCVLLVAGCAARVVDVEIHLGNIPENPQDPAWVATLQIESEKLCKGKAKLDEPSIRIDNFGRVSAKARCE